MHMVCVNKLTNIEERRERFSGIFPFCVAFSGECVRCTQIHCSLIIMYSVHVYVSIGPCICNYLLLFPKFHSYVGTRIFYASICLCVCVFECSCGDDTVMYLCLCSYVCQCMRQNKGMTHCLQPSRKDQSENFVVDSCTRKECERSFYVCSDRGSSCKFRK